MKTACAVWLVPMLVAGLGSLSPLWGQGEFKLPEDPAAWVNSGPISLKTLAGKGAVLWFYEEGCPRCRDKWPEMYALAKQYEGKPVLFIAVNSGNPRGAVEQYAGDVGLRWPTIVDPTRDFERQCGIGEISLQNIYQAGIITHDGKFRRASWDDLPGAADNALSGAKWNVDPTGIPAALQGAWLAIEFGNPAGGAAAVKKGLTSTKADIKEGATRLNAAVQEKIQLLVDAAKLAEKSGDKWTAYKQYQTAAVQYAGYDLPADVKTAQKQLGEDEAVKNQLLAQKALELAAKSLRGPSASGRRSAIAKLKKLIEDYPGTDAATEAAKLVEQAGG
ncbi:MAG: TlpA disulfide reductase family protein [Pirellulaceae bacterium]|nr:TlpA disulfide reductase family protein [Pirellulaceae bacterium]